MVAPLPSKLPVDRTTFPVTVAGATAVLAALYASLDRMIAHAPGLARLRGGA